MSFYVGLSLTKTNCSRTLSKENLGSTKVGFFFRVVVVYADSTLMPVASTYQKALSALIGQLSEQPEQAPPKVFLL